MHDNNLKEVRESRGLTQPALADLVGITDVALSCLERGQNNPRLATMRKIERVVGPVEWDKQT